MKVRPCMYYLSLCLVTIVLMGCEKSLLDDYPFPDGPVHFSSPPLDLDGARWFFGIGGLNVLPGDHGGFILKDPFSFPAKVPVLAVADGVIIRASNGVRTVPEIPDAPMHLWGMAYEDHLLHLMVSRDIIVNYAHVTTFHPDFAMKLGTLKNGEEGEEVEVIVKAGDTLGFVGPHGAMDFSVTDYNLDPGFINPSRYPNDFIYAADVTQYFVEPILSNLLDVTLRQELPRGGTHDYDVPGKIIGNWFLEGTTSFIQWSRQLAIVYHNLYGTRITLCDGSPMRDVPGIEGPGVPDTYWVRGNSPAPETIGVAQGIIKYTLIPTKDPFSPFEYVEEMQPDVGEVLIQMVEPGKIKIEFFKGSTAPAAFTAAAKVYVR